MKKILFFVILLSAGFVGRAQTHDVSPLQARLKNHVYFLASDSLRGREAGSVDAKKAAFYVRDEFEAIGLQSFFSDMLVPFSTPDSIYTGSLGGNLGSMVDAALESMASGKMFVNVIAFIEGSDPVLKDEYILVGAHYDHLGVRGGQVYNGADDNASGTAAVIEVARLLMEHRSELKRSVIICAFDAEELGLFGSTALSKKFHDEVKLMMSLDMVGWYQKTGALTLEGTGTLDKAARHTIESEAEQRNIRVRTKAFETSSFGATDTEPFAKRGVPTLYVTTGLKSPYHKPGDDADLIDYKGMEEIVEYLAALVADFAHADALKPSGRVAPKHGGPNKIVELGVDLGCNRTRLNFEDAGISTHRAMGWQTGLNLRLNMGRLVLMGQADYRLQRARLPEIDLTDQTFSYATNPDKMRLHLLDLPVGLYVRLFGKGGMGDVLLGGGVYCTHLLRTTTHSGLSPQTPWGWHWGIGARLGKVACMATTRYQINDVFSVSQAPQAKGISFEFRLTWYPF